MFLCLGYILYNRARILSMKNDGDLTIFLSQEHTIHIAKYLTLVDKLWTSHNNKVRYDFKLSTLGVKRYEPMC